MRGIVAVVFLAMAIATGAAGQTVDGIVDRGADTRVQIDELETILRGNADMPAERQAVMLLWLAELYEYVGDSAGVESSYLRILAFFPYDVGVMNRYAAFLLDGRGESARAESLLVAASQWGRYTDARSLDRGRTYELLARVEMENGDLPAAERHALMAIELVDDEASAGARRVLAETLHRAGAHDAAVEEYIDLIALERGTHREDINSVRVIAAASDRYRNTDLNRLVEEAIVRREAARRDRIESEGAELVAVTARDGVELEGTLRRRGGSGAVLMIPGRNNTRSVWTPYAQLLGIDGISSLTLDLRGQGGSRSDSLPSPDGLDARHRERLPDDVVAGFRYLRDALSVAGESLVIAGEGDACAVIEKALRRGRLDAAVVYLSPGFDRGDRELRDAVSFHPRRPALLYYSREDLHALRSTSYFKKNKDLPDLTVNVLDRAGHGTDILRRDPGALESFQVWLRRVTGSR